MRRKNDSTDDAPGGALPSVVGAGGGPKEGSILPAASAEGMTPPASSPSRAFEAKPEEPVAAAASVPASGGRAERLAAATRAGGLEDLPADFGDPEGDWESVLSENPFEVLYLDFRQISAIPQRMVEHHRNLLRGFWQEKMKILSQGGGRVAIARKYGGPDADENRVRNFPDRIEKAFHQLSTAGGMERVYLEIVHRREEKAIAEIKAKLGDFLIDGVLHPRETAFLFELADQLDLRRAVVADLIDTHLRRLGLKSQGVPLGNTLEEQLVSVVWASSAHPSLGPPPPPASRTGLFPLLSLAALLLAVTLVAWLAGRSQVPDAPLLAPGNPAALRSSEATGQGPSPAPVSPPRSKPQPSPQPARSASPPVAEKTPERKREDLQELRRQLEKDQRETLARLEQENVAKIELERSRQWEEQLSLLTDFNRQESFEAALTLSEKLLAEEALPEPLVLRARELAQNASAGIERQRMAEWRRRLAEVEELFKKGIYTETKIQADLLAAEAAAPPEIAERARKLAEGAVEALRADWSKTKAKSTTVRSKNGRQNGDGK